MSIIAWILLGLVAGYVASLIVDGAGSSPVVDILLGIVGAFVGGFLFNEMGSAGVTGFNVYSLFVAVIGAVVFLMIYHLLARGRGTI